MYPFSFGRWSGLGRAGETKITSVIEFSGCCAGWASAEARWTAANNWCLLYLLLFPVLLSYSTSFSLSFIFTAASYLHHSMFPLFLTLLFLIFTVISYSFYQNVFSLKGKWSSMRTDTVQEYWGSRRRLDHQLSIRNQKVFPAFSAPRLSGNHNIHARDYNTTAKTGFEPSLLLLVGNYC